MTTRPPILTFVSLGNGIVLAMLVFLSQFWAAYPIADRYGPDASYDAFILAVAAMVPLSLILGIVTVPVVKRTVTGPRELILTVLGVDVLCIALLVMAAFLSAANSTAGRWYIENLGG